MYKMAHQTYPAADWERQSSTRSWPTGVEPEVFFCRHSPSASRFDLLCCVFWDAVLRTTVVNSSVTIGSNQSAILLRPLSSTRRFRPRNVFVHRTIMHNLWRLCVCEKIPGERQCLKYWNQPIWLQQPCHSQAKKNPGSNRSALLVIMVNVTQNEF